MVIRMEIIVGLLFVICFGSGLKIGLSLNYKQTIKDEGIKDASHSPINSNNFVNLTEEIKDEWLNGMEGRSNGE